MYSSCESSLLETTYSQDIRIAANLKRMRQKLSEDQAVEDIRRKRIFEEIYQEQEAIIFQLQGMNITKYSYEKIKFLFIPSEIVEHVSKKVVFHCTLIYLTRYGKWKIKNDSFPVNYKWRIYPMLYDNDFLAIYDEQIHDLIFRIYKILHKWAIEEDRSRISKYKRYLEGEDVYLDEDDEEIFLSDKEREELHSKRSEILRRMIVPERRLRRKH